MSKFKIIMLVVLGVVFISVVLFLFLPVCATYQYKQDYTDICIYLPRWKILLFNLVGFRTGY